MIPEASAPFLLCEATDSKHELPDRFTIGRSESSNLVIDSTRVSRRHGVIQRDENIFNYIDLQSANGSRVNGQRLVPNQKIALSHGSIIKVANRQFVFCEKEDPELMDRTVLTRGDPFTKLRLITKEPDSPDSANKEKTNIQTKQQDLLREQLSSIENGDTELLSYLKTGIDQVIESPETALLQCRLIALRALDLILSAEFPTKRIPEALIRQWKTSPHRFKDEQIYNGRIPVFQWHQLELLRVMTGSKGVAPVAEYISKATYHLLNTIYSVGQPAGHPEERYFQQCSFAISTMIEGVTLCELLAEELPR